MLNLKKTLTKLLTQFSELSELSAFIPKHYGSYVNNVNTLYHTGIGYTDNATGQPSGANGTILVFGRGSDAWVFQFFIRYDTATIFTRHCNNGTWSAWRQN